VFKIFVVVFFFWIAWIPTLVALLTTAAVWAIKTGIVVSVWIVRISATIVLWLARMTMLAIKFRPLDIDLGVKIRSLRCVCIDKEGIC
jgi:hypothetical protein